VVLDAITHQDQSRKLRNSLGRDRRIRREIRREPDAMDALI
jgi:hypothetical protein